MNNLEKKLLSVRKLLEAQGDKEEQIKATLDLVGYKYKAEKWNNIRSWIGTLTGIVAIVISILVAIYK